MTPLALLRSADRSVLAIAAGGTVLALLCLWASFHALRKRRLLADLPTSRAHGVFIGLVELVGSAESARPLTSVLRAASCVWYRYEVAERWSRTVTETHVDSKGKTYVTTRTESGWKTIRSGGAALPFHLRDETGAVYIRPEGADVEPLVVFEEECGRREPLYYAEGPPNAVADSDHRRRFQETAIPVGTQLYVVGQAREREDVVAPEIAADPEAPLFLISTRSEQSVGRGLAGWAWFFGILALVLSAGTALLAAEVATPRRVGPSWPALLAGVGALSLAWSAGWTWTVYNSLVSLRQRVSQAWSLVDVQLRRRHDLVPRLVAIVRGFLDFESRVQREVAELRAQADATRPGTPGVDPRACLPAVRTIVERYPALRANEAFLDLQRRLSETEQRIALARSYFNDVATFYNTRLEQVPDRWVARIARLRPEGLIQAEDFERAPVAVELRT